MTEYGLFTMAGEITALSPLSHNGDTPAGNSTRLRRQVVILRDGAKRSIPYISGNAIRGYLRRRAMADMLREADYTVDITKAGGKRLWHAMFSGGILSKGASMDLAAKREVFETIPMIRLFGWAWGNQMIESKMKVSNMMPFCRELHGPKETPIRHCVKKVFHTRKADRWTEVEDGSGDEPHQMIYETEVFVQGTRFSHRFTVEDPTDLDLSALSRVIELWRRYPTIGGKSAIGMGEVNLEYDRKGITDGAYLQYVKDRTGAIRSVLDGLTSDKKP